MLAQTNKINTSNAVKDNMFAQFEWHHSCALFKNSKHLFKVEMLKARIEWRYNEKYLMKARTLMIFVAIGLGLVACSNVALKVQPSVTSVRLLQTNEATTTGYRLSAELTPMKAIFYHSST